MTDVIEAEPPGTGTTRADQHRAGPQKRSAAVVLAGFVALLAVGLGDRLPAASAETAVANSDTPTTVSSTPDISTAAASASTTSTTATTSTTSSTSTTSPAEPGGMDGPTTTTTTAGTGDPTAAAPTAPGGDTTPTTSPAPVPALPRSLVAGTSLADSAKPPIPRLGKAYLGAWLNPTDAQDRIRAELQALSGFNSRLGRHLSIVHVYQPWDHPVSTGVLKQFLASGAMPMIDWSCGDFDANIAAGGDDAFIEGYARSLASLKAPLFLRWYWEPNFLDSSNAYRCKGDAGPAGYAAAFRRIHDDFVAAGADNVAFVWCMATAGTTNFRAYWPGKSYVDWVAADGYDRARSADTGGSKFVKQFSGWYDAVSPFGLPMMISETAAYRTPDPVGGGSVADAADIQASYLKDILATISEGKTFPALKAVLYFDASYPNHPWGLDPAGTIEFAKLSQSKAFQPALVPTTLTLAPPSVTLRSGRRSVLVASLTQPIPFGSVTFEADGVPIGSCAAVLAFAKTSCSSVRLPPGTAHLSAIFSGNALYEASESRTTAVTVVPDTAVPGSPGPGHHNNTTSADPAGSGHLAAPLLPSSLVAGWQPDIGGANWRPQLGVGTTPAAMAVPRPASFAPDSLVGNDDPSPFDLNGAVASWTKDQTQSLLSAGTAWSAGVALAVLMLLAYMGRTWLQDVRRPAAAPHNTPVSQETTDW